MLGVIAMGTTSRPKTYGRTRASRSSCRPRASGTCTLASVGARTAQAWMADGPVRVAPRGSPSDLPPPPDGPPPFDLPAVARAARGRRRCRVTRAARRDLSPGRPGPDRSLPERGSDTEPHLYRPSRVPPRRATGADGVPNVRTRCAIPRALHAGRAFLSARVWLFATARPRPRRKAFGAEGSRARDTTPRVDENRPRARHKRLVAGKKAHAGRLAKNEGGAQMINEKPQIIRSTEGRLPQQILAVRTGVKPALTLKTSAGRSGPRSRARRVPSIVMIIDTKYRHRACAMCARRRRPEAPRVAPACCRRIRGVRSATTTITTLGTFGGKLEAHAWRRGRSAKEVNGGRPHRTPCVSRVCQDPAPVAFRLLRPRDPRRHRRLRVRRRVLEPPPFGGVSRGQSAEIATAERDLRADAPGVRRVEASRATAFTGVARGGPRRGAGGRRADSLRRSLRAHARRDRGEGGRISRREVIGHGGTARRAARDEATRLAHSGSGTWPRSRSAPRGGRHLEPCGVFTAARRRRRRRRVANEEERGGVSRRLRVGAGGVSTRGGPSRGGGELTAP